MLKAKNILTFIDADRRKVDKFFKEIETQKSFKKIQGLTLHSQAKEHEFYSVMY